MVFDRLWKTMKERGVSQYKLIKEYKIRTGQLDRLRKNENVNTYTLDQLCRILNCGLGRYRGIQRKLKPEGSAFRFSAPGENVHCGGEHVGGLGVGEGRGIDAFKACDSACVEVGCRLCGPGRHGVGIRAAHVGEAEQPVEHNGGLGAADIGTGVEHRALAPLDNAVLYRARNIGALPVGDAAVVGKPGADDAAQHVFAGDVQAHCGELAAAERFLRLEVIVAADLLADKRAALGKAHGAAIACAAAHIDIADAFVFDEPDYDRRLLRAVAVGVDGLIAEVVAAALAVDGGIDEAAVVTELYRALFGLGGDLEAHRVALGIDGGEPTAEGHAAVGLEFEVFRNRRGAVGQSRKHKRAQRKARQHGCNIFAHKKYLRIIFYGGIL